ncbi:GGDEF domain-containing protein [Sulfuriflexus mobilis]|uniref:GGDEF domain-containing protein n=1 Tax=Sulfuriflexus mobilis TaxID=1811807 RepID=UPI000F84275B|nr:GGDEF domain-containing protein [Sulfuriflexus mobilis]
MEQLEQTLAEQLQITKREIEKRKELLDFTADDEAILLYHKPLFNKYIDGIVAQFYERQIQVTEISLLIGDAETLRRLQSAMRRYILELFDGHYDEEYVNRRLRIGKVHQRIGVSPKLYIAAVHLLRKVLLKTITMQFFGKEESQEVKSLEQAINKLLMFDIQLVFDTYIASLISEVNMAKEEVADYARNLEDEVATRTRQLEELSLKDALTGLYNQRAFYDHLRREVANSERYQEVLSLCYFDLNGFKNLNDTEGHVEGDAVLELVGKVTMAELRDTDIGCRYGGDEFCLILPKTNPDEARVLTDRIIKTFEASENKGISFSLGITSMGPDEFMDIDSFVKHADALMYKSKAKSRKKPGFYTTLGT